MMFTNGVRGTGGKPEGAHEHRELGFHEGWNAALDQLLALDVGADAIDGP